MADDLLTLADVAVFDNLDADLGISEVLAQSPTVASLFAETTEGRTFLYEKKTQNPVTGFREANAGRAFDSGVHAEQTITLKILDASFAVDVAVAAADKRGTAARLGMELAEHLESAFYTIEDQIWNGTDAVSGFASLPSQIDSSMLIAADTPTGNQVAAPIYLLNTGEKGVGLVLGEMGRIMVGNESIINMVDGTGKNFPAWYTPVTSWVGMASKHKYAIAGKNAAVTIDDDLIGDLYSSFPIGFRPNLLVTNRTGLKKLQQSRTATNPTGQPAPYPMTWDAAGMPIRILVTDAIADVTPATTTTT